jgi:uncharacterized protein
MVDKRELTAEEKTYGMLAHLTALAGFIIPFGFVLGPLVIWLMKKDQSEWVDKQGKEALNFNISIAIYGIVAGILTLIVIGLFLAIAVGVFWLVMVIMATVKVNNLEDFQYPLTIRFMK